MLDLLEADCMPKVVLSDAVMTFRNLSHQPEGPWTVPLANGHCMGAVDLLLKFYEAGRKEFHGRDHETDVLLRIWKETLEALATKPESLVGKIDWISKRWLFQQFMEEQKLSWSDPWLKSQDLEFHHIDPARSLGRALDTTPDEWQLTPKDIDKATQKAPANTRASVRSQAMQLVKGLGVEYYIDWEIMGAEAKASLQLLDPFDASTKQIDPWLKAAMET
jgi:proteasome accessory factor A